MIQLAKISQASRRPCYLIFHGKTATQPLVVYVVSTFCLLRNFQGKLGKF